MPPSRKDIVIDRIIQSEGQVRKRAEQGKTRLIGVRTDKGVMEFLTTNLKHSVHTVGQIYKLRWQIESFFKTLKQNLKFNRFVPRRQFAVGAPQSLSVTRVTAVPSA